MLFGQIGFIENKGQFDDRVVYEAEYQTHKIYLTEKGFSVLLHDEQKWSKMINRLHNHRTRAHSELEEAIKDTIGFQHVFYTLEGGDLSRSSGVVKVPEYYNYFLGADSSKWASNVAKYTKVLYTDVYPKIDLEFEAIDRRFKYNFILRPGADIKDIKINIEGADSFRVTKDRLIVSTQFGDFSEIIPISYEVRGDARTPITMNYTLENGLVGFTTKMFRNKVQVVIDPELIFSTYSGSTVDNFGFTATFDDEGNMYAGGIATSPTSVVNGRYPATVGSFDLTFNGGYSGGVSNRKSPWDISLSKYSADGSTLVYATYLGGSHDEYPHSLIVGEGNELILFGTSQSDNYPITAGAVSELKRGGVDMVITRFNQDGSELVGSTYIGGNSADGLNSSPTMTEYYADEYRGEINLDAFGNIVVASCTYSPDFPTTSGALQPILIGGQEGVVFSLSANLTTLRWSTFLGGNDMDALYSIDQATDGSFYVSGGTSSKDLAKTQSAFRSDYLGGTADGFVSKISNDGKTLDVTSYFGSDLYDQILMSDLDFSGNVYIVGHTRGMMPTKGEVYSNANGKQFIAKLSSDLSELEVSTVYGSGGPTTDLTINAFLVDECGKVYVSGWGTNFGADGYRLDAMPITPDAFQKTTNGQDFHILVLEENLESLVFGSYFGGTLTDDHVDGGTSRFDKRGIMYQSVCSSCPSQNGRGQISDFPTSEGAYSETNPSPRCSNASFKIRVANQNFKPRMEDEVFNVSVLDELQFSYVIQDDASDSLRATYTWGSELSSAVRTGESELRGLGEITNDFLFQFGCEHAGDTFLINAYAVDQGCPSSEDNNSLISIIVDSVPLLPPPPVLCLNFLGDEKLRIDWESTESSRYFKEMVLYKIDPNGNKSVLQYIDNQGPGSYTDEDVINPRNTNYTYYIEVLNICDVAGPQTYNLSSVKESEVPADHTYLKTVTVEGSELKLVFLKSKEDDFGSYQVFKKDRVKGTYRFYKEILSVNDTVFFDTEVNVNEVSYCYQIRVTDGCGHLSKMSNEGCSIVLRGIAQNKKGQTPRYYMDLYWDDYKDWQDGVSKYELLRSVDTGNLRPARVLNSATTEYIDGKLDYDWGGYWYSVLAYENEGGHNAVSRSNDIYLIQPPEVFVPNAVTLNNDGLNDSFGWADVFVREFTMDIYNRWGEKVFSTTDKNDRWSSVYKEGDLKYSNVYMWIVSYYGWDNTRHYDSGTVTFLK